MIYRERVLPFKYEKAFVQHIDDLRKIVEDPDNAMYIDPELRKLLIEKNMIMYLGYPLTPSTRPNPDKELGIGEVFAWQLNVYRILVKDRILEQL